MGFVFEKVDDSFFPTGTPVGGGEETSYLENYRPSRDVFESKNRSDSQYNELRKKIDPIINTVNERLNTNLANPMTELKREEIPIEKMWESTFDNDINEVFDIIKKNKGLFPEYDGLSLDGIYKEVANDIGQLELKQADIVTRQTALGAVGEFAGMAAAAATDPVNVTAMALDVLFTKGAAKTATSAFLGKQTLQLMLRESLIAATSESVIQKPVSDWYKTLDLPYDFNTFASNVLAASAGAAVFTGAISSIVPGIKLGKKATMQGVEAFEKASALVKGVKYKKNPDIDFASKLDDVDEIVSESNPNLDDAGDFEHIKTLDETESILNEKGIDEFDNNVDANLEADVEINAKEFDGPNSRGYEEQMAILGSEFEEEFAAKGDAFLEETVPIDMLDPVTNEFVPTEVKIKDIADEIAQDKTMVERLEGCLS